MLEIWNDDQDRFSFEDSERFEEDSLCSWSTEPEAICNNWRGWKRPVASISIFTNGKKATPDTNVQQRVPQLCELAARCVASHIPFELVEQVYPPVPEQLQLQIAFWSFPDNEEDIRLYSCLANSSADEFQRGEHLFKNRAVKDPLQIGFHLSASVLLPSSYPQRGQYNVAIAFDRRRITSCNCTCDSSAYWCSHVVAVCLHRIHMPTQVCLRAPVSESLSRLHRDQLQKFAQYLISELPQQILPTAQRILDELLSSQPSAINSVCGAPDPTAGASVNEQTSWYLDEKTLHNNIKKILVKFCVPAPIVFSDVNYLSTTAPPAAAEWTSLLRPLRGREPEGMWNLLSIVREMYKRSDRNALPLLQIITEECLACEQIMVWWFNTKVTLHVGVSSGGKHSNVNSNTHGTQHACASLCDEVVLLWRLAALDPALSAAERVLFCNQFNEWHTKIVDKVGKSRPLHANSAYQTERITKNSASSIEVFSGFKPAISACQLDWEDYPIMGVTYQGGAAWLSQPMCFKNSDNKSDTPVNPISSSQAVLNQRSGHHNYHFRSKPRRTMTDHSKQLLDDIMDLTLPMYQLSTSGRSQLAFAMGLGGGTASGNRSSVSSEGFCENEQDNNNQDEDCNDGDSSEAISNQRSEQDLLYMGRASTSGCHSGDIAFRRNKQLSHDSSEPISNQRLEQDLLFSGRASTSDCHTADIAFRRNKQLSHDSTEAISNQRSEQDILFSGRASTSGCHATDIAFRRNKQLSHGSHLHHDSLDFDVLGESESSSSSCSERRDLSHPPASESPSGDESETSKQEPPQTDPRRLSKDDSLSTNSDSQQSSDEYFMYYYDPKSLDKSTIGKGAEKKEDERQRLPLSGVSGPKDPWDILFARAEGLHAHGHNKEACILGVELAEDLLDNPPNLMVDLPPIQTKGKRRKINPASHQLSILASDTLSKCAFLCTVLAENPEHYHLAFRVGLFGLEMPRPPATTKPLEVKLFHQESELVTLLKRIPLGENELNMLRKRAQLLRDGILRARGEALLPITLASFILDSLTMPDSKCQLMSQPLRSPSDEQLGFEAATAALGLKANVSEADHPLLCEGTRRQRGDLAVTLLVHYKDQPSKIAHIMEKLLDREVHQLVKAPLLSSYYTAHPPVKSMMSSMCDWNTEVEHPPLDIPPPMASVDPNLVLPMRHTACSSTSELDACLPTKPINIPHIPQTSASTIPTTTRPKETRFKGKRAYPSIPNQPSEAGAHFMFELAKTVLVKAGGNSSTSLFTQASTSQNHHGPQRALHMCAFQLGLYALGLHNCVSPNWLSRTYSSHVSWITGQAMEIGAPAISFLQDTWEGHLTPPEAVSIADRASRGCDRNMARAAADLALSCLPHAHALNPNEIQRAILQCKEQSDRMLEHSCLTVEGAAKGGGVYPDVLFQVAKYWFELYLRNSQGEQFVEESMGFPADPQLGVMTEPPPQHISTAMVAWVEPQPPPTPPPPPPQYVSPLTTIPYPLITIAPPQHYQLRHPHQISVQTFHLPAPPFQYYQTSQPAHVFSATPIQVGPGQAQIANIAQAPAPPVTQPPPVVTVAAPVRPQQQQVQRTHQQYTTAQVRYLLAAYRVGMLAMETLARRVHDDRPNAKYARHPPYGEDVKWLLRIAEKLGTQYLQQFCVCAVNSIVSPFILHDVAIEAAHYLGRNNPSLILQHLRSSLTPLVQKCQQMYIQCLHQKLYHLTSSEYEEFLNIILSARGAFQITPEGSQQFKEWLQSIRRSKSCKKELWAQISLLLQPTNGK